MNIEDEYKKRKEESDKLIQRLIAERQEAKKQRLYFVVGWYDRQIKKQEHEQRADNFIQKIGEQSAGEELGLFEQEE